MRVLSIIIILIFIILIVGCGTTSFSYVGSYKYPGNSWESKDYAKWMGHKGRDIRNPTSEEIEFYCSVCHHVW